MQFYCISTLLSVFLFSFFVIRKTKNGCIMLLVQKKTRILFTFFPRLFCGNACFCFRLNLRQAGNSIDLFLSKCKRQLERMERGHHRVWVEWNTRVSVYEIALSCTFVANYNKRKKTANMYPLFRLFDSSPFSNAISIILFNIRTISSQKSFSVKTMTIIIRWRDTPNEASSKRNLHTFRSYQHRFFRVCVWDNDVNKVEW